MLSAETLCERPWRLSAGAGTLLAPQLRFIGDGLTWGQPSPLEARWRLNDAGLSLLAIDGSETARFTEIGYDESGEPQLSGQFLRAAEAALPCCLKPAAPLAPLRQAGTLRCEVTLGSQSKSLFVSFASLKRGFIDHQARWEFYRLPLELGIDHIRIAESWSPEFMWYVDKTRQVGALLNGILQGGYDQVVMCGMSSGGYASLLFSELLAPQHPGIEFRTFSINAQTTHAASARAWLAHLPADYLPAMISDEALSLRDTPETDIAAIAKHSRFRANVQHHLFYDSGNQAEVFYVGQLSGLSGIHLHPHPFAVGHLSGCIALFEREVVHDAVRAAVAAGRGAA